MRSKVEAQEQIAFIEWCRVCGTPFSDIYAVENEGARTPQSGAYAKRMGKKAGVADLFFPRACGKYHGLYIEMKTHAKSSKQTPTQIEFEQMVNSAGYAYHVCRDAGEAIATVKTYWKLGAAQ